MSEDERTSADTVLDGERRSEAGPGDRSVPIGRSDLASGQKIGPYRLIERIGVGGMGEVWIADQHQPVRRKVALKCMRRGLGSAEVVARFESERQALALMDHPGIARIYDAGVLDDDRPWFAMELVQGLPITDFCNRHRLTLSERIDVFRQVCSAVQHAHHKAILHRDLKPSNILVAQHEGGASVKVIDFGIAKAMGASLVGETLHTRLGQVIGTPAYMSPEQADPFDVSVDVRSDVYSLGVILYELLTGELPYSPTSEPTRGRQTSKRDGPPRPSTKVRRQTESVVAERRCTDSRQLASRLKGELDWITLKALHPEPGSRYNSPTELADDLKRYLRRRPVEAGPPSTLYRLRRFYSRHAFASSAAVGIVLALIVGSILAALGLREARQAEARAVRQAETTEQVSRFLIGLFEGSDPRENRGVEISAREMLDRGVERLGELESEPLVRARLLQATADIYRELGEHDRAVELMEEALAIWRRRGGLDGKAAEIDIDAVRLLAEYGDTLREDDRFQDAESTLLEVSSLLERLPEATDRDRAKNGNDLALVYDQLGRSEEAEALHRKSLEIRRRVDGERSESVATSLHNLSLAVGKRDRREAVELEERAIDIRRELLGEDHPRVASSLVSLGTTLESLGELEKSERTIREALEIRRRLGVRDERLAHTLGELGWVLYRQRRFDAADDAFREAVEVAEKTSGGARVELAFLTNNWSLMQKELGRYDEAVDNLTRSVAVRREVYQAPNAVIHKAEASLAGALLDAGDVERALPVVRRALDGYRALGQEDTATFRQVETQEVRGLFATPGVEIEEARSAADGLLSRMRDAGDPELAVARARRALGEGLLASGRAAEAAEVLRQAEREVAEASPQGDTERAITLALLGDALRRQGSDGPAIEAYRRSLDHFASSVGDRHPRARAAREALETLRGGAARAAPPRHDPS